MRLAALGWLGMYNYTYLWLGRGGSRFDVQEIAAQYHEILVSGMRASVSA